MIQVCWAAERIASGRAAWHSTMHPTPNSTAWRRISGWCPQMSTVSLAR